MIYDIYYIVYTIYCILYTIYCILHTMYYILYAIYCVLDTIYYILYTIYYIIYTCCTPGGGTEYTPRTTTTTNDNDSTTGNSSTNAKTTDNAGSPTCHILPPSEIDWGLFCAVFPGSEGKYLFHRIGRKGRICQLWELHMS